MCTITKNKTVRVITNTPSIYSLNGSFLSHPHHQRKAFISSTLCYENFLAYRKKWEEQNNKHLNNIPHHLH